LTYRRLQEWEPLSFLFLFSFIFFLRITFQQFLSPHVFSMFSGIGLFRPGRLFLAPVPPRDTFPFFCCRCLVFPRSSSDRLPPFYRSGRRRTRSPSYLCSPPLSRLFVFSFSPILFLFIANCELSGFAFGIFLFVTGEVQALVFFFFSGCVVF